MIHYFKIQITMTKGIKDVTKLDWSTTELFYVQFVQVTKNPEKKIDYRSHASIFDWMHIFLPLVLILFVLNCTEPATRDEQHNFYMSRFNSVMLTFYMGSFFIGLFFLLLTRGPLFFPVQNGLTAIKEIETKKMVWDTIALKLCFFVNGVTSIYLVLLQIFKLYEDNVNLRRIEVMRKRLWIFQRVEIIALAIGFLVGIFGSLFPRHTV